jgi:predicted membrane chloride channel (bestrophin family)
MLTLPFVIVLLPILLWLFEAIADELEDPFGFKPNDLALDAGSGNDRKTPSEIEDNKHIEPIENLNITISLRFIA